MFDQATLAKHTQNGVTIIDPATTFISPDAAIGKDTTILPFVVIRERVTIGEGCEIGPFTHIRPDVTLGDNVKAGAFVELKNSTLGDGTKAGHLAYVGDSDVGKNVNFGCGTVTVNHDGARKHRSVIEDNAYIGCNTNLVAPVTVGEGAYTAAGSTVTQDVPPGALAIARARQVNKENWKRPARD
jgi:bifunctional UDP-N-acetylglucosamine pyrophosphorylase/glucosamine-1-phosphate N-acetyltransferase